MSNLSEEEVIEKIKHLIKSSNDRTDLLSYLDEKTKESLQGLLDLYNKEKEKNTELKVLIEQNLKYSHNLEKDLFENCSNYVISKDKIREIIYPTPDNPISYEVQTSAMYKKLEQLLEEE